MIIRRLVSMLMACLFAYVLCTGCATKPRDVPEVPEAPQAQQAPEAKPDPLLAEVEKMYDFSPRPHLFSIDAPKTHEASRKSLVRERDELFEIFESEEYQEQLGDFKKLLKAAHEIEESFTAARAKGADESVLSGLTKKYALKVHEIRKSFKELLDEVYPLMSDVDASVTMLAVTRIGMTQTETDELKSIVRPLVKHVTPLIRYGRVINPVVRSALKKAPEYPTTYEYLSAEVDEEKFLKTCREMLES